MEEMNLKCCAHLGDAVYEVFIREKIIYLTTNLAKLHKINTNFVCATYQCKLLEYLEPTLTDKEKEIIRRGRNIPSSSSRRINQSLHRLATGFEALIGYLHLYDKKRLGEIFEIIGKKIETELNSPTEP